MATIWKPVKGYENYIISTDGKVKNIITGKILKGGQNQKGYLQVQLYKNGKRIQPFIHKLVAEAFIDNPDNKPQVNHIDGNKTNNNISNLEWCDNRENQNHAIKNHLRKNLLAVYQYSKDHKFIKKWETSAEAMRALKIDRSHILDVCKGKRKTAGGYIWSFEGVSV